ncbi:hypothetical protein [Nocardioides speluncae]|uniref:hypothetical protein n=1 Tax=Nocardioides speluncae TaxID=2670337 RepID=UPI00137AA617|nr:hypothetical protein [Nocardioides speluncae]
MIWTSITQQYWPTTESEAVEDAVVDARSRIRLARITMEGVPPTENRGGYDLAEHGPALRVDGELIARSHHHGLPVVPNAR